ncbi:NUDIX domain-containing protein, partial [Propionivibrio sp.]|uniref:NUDIX domain-containing protein n=1 Tax=Propionivibrio sp. TaxID=2212460 RepID=UPI00345C54B3
MAEGTAGALIGQDIAHRARRKGLPGNPLPICGEKPRSRTTICGFTPYRRGRPGGRSCRDSAHNGAWTLPGGWCDTGESPSLSAEREVAEESGLQVRAVRLVALFDKLKHDHP